MNLIWVMLLMPITAQEHVTVFPKSFATRESCQSLGQILIVKREFRCIQQERRIEVVGLPNGWVVAPPDFVVAGHG